jgi:endonuclease/exonuclease/phosphatase family metal-dependent hydrolase
VTDSQQAGNSAIGFFRARGLPFLSGISLAYPILLLIFSCVVNPLVGERNATFAFLLYLPQSIWIFSLLPFALVGWFFWRRWFWIHPVALILFIIFSMGWRLRWLSPDVDIANGLTVRVMTFNRGQNFSYSLQPFKNHEQPDVILLQEVPRRETNYRRSEGYREFPYIQSMGEFVAMSKWPILDCREVRSPQRVVFDSGSAHKSREVDSGRGDLLAMRLELQLPGGVKFALYNVHFPTPRDILTDCKRGGFLGGVLGIPGTSLGKKRIIYEDYWQQRIDQAEYFINQVNKDALPTIIAGDFNMPDNGYIYRLFAGHWKDSHYEAGSGFGYTFPGITRNLFSLGAAWLRLDYVFSRRGWVVARAAVESQGRSQHRPLSVTLVFQHESPS